ncbi:hypothetical protein [Amycolatopsis aidingensis]|uniref:hypothetical protein n=1 Tax=Amycolatopsis aidingensis TaxID=2842453 RepID=UPI001C0B11A3|nr:hypothetical protein [Amycolatopsis aidingensis]
MSLGCKWTFAFGVIVGIGFLMLAVLLAVFFIWDARRTYGVHSNRDPALSVLALAGRLARERMEGSRE